MINATCSLRSAGVAHRTIISRVSVRLEPMENWFDGLVFELNYGLCYCLSYRVPRDRNVLMMGRCWHWPVDFSIEFLFGFDIETLFSFSFSTVLRFSSTTKRYFSCRYRRWKNLQKFNQWSWNHRDELWCARFRHLFCSMEVETLT